MNTSKGNIRSFITAMFGGSPASRIETRRITCIFPAQKSAARKLQESEVIQCTAKPVN